MVSLLKAKTSAVLDEVAFLVSVDLVHVAFSLMTRLALAGTASDSERALVGDNNWPTQVFAEVFLQTRDGVLGSSHVDCHTIHHFHIKPLHMNADQVLPLEVGGIDIWRGKGVAARVRCAAAA